MYFRFIYITFEYTIFMPKLRPKQLEMFPRIKSKPRNLKIKRKVSENLFTYQLRTNADIFAEAHVLLNNGNPLLYSIKIKPGFESLQRIGFAKRLLNNLIEDLKSNGYSNLRLVVDVGKGAFLDYDPRKELKLIRYYSRFGFRVIGKDSGFFIMRLDF